MLVSENLELNMGTRLLLVHILLSHFAFHEILFCYNKIQSSFCGENESSTCYLTELTENVTVLGWFGGTNLGELNYFHFHRLLAMQ